MDDEAPRERVIAQAYVGMWNSGDASRVAELVTEDFVSHGCPHISNRADLYTAIQAHRLDKPLSHILIDAVLGDGPMVTVVCRIQGNESGEPEMRDAVWTLRIEDRVAEMWTYLDLQAVPEL